MKPLIFLLCSLFFSCSGIDLIDDYVPPTLRITSTLEEVPVGSSFEISASYFNNVGDFIQGASIQWTSLNPGGEMALNIGEKWGISATITHPLFGRVIFKTQTFSGGIFFAL